MGPDTTTDDVLAGVDLTNTTVLVTGASSGLGVETARALAAHGASLVLGVRDTAKARRALADAGVDGSAYELRTVDLADLASVRAFTDAVAADHDHLDLLVANAGVMACPQDTTADGFETQFGTNHLGHFVLVNRLVPLLVAGAPSRVVILSSAAHRMSDVDLDDPGFERTPYDPWAAYGRSKTANALFALELDRRLRDRGVRVAAVHPGVIQTELTRYVDEETMALLRQRRGGRRITIKSVPAGAATTVWAGVVADPDEIGGRYCEDCHVAEPAADATSPTGFQPYAQDPERAAALWRLSEDLVGERFP
jgi:NAD(P)-dependent dehydrogenase (short-subunit alcohol dehydrogenase family)